jgi:hypothetical protein
MILVIYSRILLEERSMNVVAPKMSDEHRTKTKNIITLHKKTIFSSITTSHRIIDRHSQCYLQP